MEIFVGNLALELVKQGHQVHLLYGGKEHPHLRGKNLIAHPFHPVKIPYVRAIDFRCKCSNLCIGLTNEFEVDAVIASGAGTFPSYIFSRIKKLKRKCLRVYYAMDSMKMEYERSKISAESRRLLMRLDRWIWYTFLIKSDRASCIYSDLVLASSRDTANHLTADYGASPGKIALLYPGVPDDFAEGIRTLDPDIPVFLHIAGGVRKGTNYFLKAMKLLEERYGLKAKAIITRASPINMKQARELGIDTEIYERVSKLELAHIYSSCTCLVAPSLSEGFCLPVIEAAMFGKPVIVTRIGSLPELVNDGIDGFVIAVADVDSLAERMYELATNDELRGRMSIKAKEKAEKFKISAVAKNLIHIISLS